VKEKGVKYRTKVREYQVNCLAQRVEDKKRRGGGEATKATPPPTCATLIETGVRVYWEKKDGREEAMVIYILLQIES
jgi:hypothetical protein